MLPKKTIELSKSLKPPIQESNAPISFPITRHPNPRPFTPASPSAPAATASPGPIRSPSISMSRSEYWLSSRTMGPSSTPPRRPLSPTARAVSPSSRSTSRSASEESAAAAAGAGVVVSFLRYERSARHSATVLCASDAAAAAVVAVVCAPIVGGPVGVPPPALGVPTGVALAVLGVAVLTTREARDARILEGAAVGVVAALDASDDTRGGANIGGDLRAGDGGDGERRRGRAQRRRLDADSIAVVDDCGASRRGVDRLASEYRDGFLSMAGARDRDAAVRLACGAGACDGVSEPSDGGRKRAISDCDKTRRRGGWAESGSRRDEGRWPMSSMEDDRSCRPTVPLVQWEGFGRTPKVQMKTVPSTATVTMCFWCDDLGGEDPLGLIRVTSVMPSVWPQSRPTMPPFSS